MKNKLWWIFSTCGHCIDPLAIVIYNPENVPPIESTVSTEFDTFDEDQYVKKNSTTTQSGDDDANE